MDKTYTLREAKAQLSALLDMVAEGEDVEILRQRGKRGRFRIVMVEADGALRRPGALKDDIGLPEDFDAEDPALTAAFEGAE